jgi:hypothetical protein
MHLEVHFGGENDVVAAGVPSESPAHDHLRTAVAVDVGGIPDRFWINLQTRYDLDVQLE